MKVACFLVTEFDFAGINWWPIFNYFSSVSPLNFNLTAISPGIAGLP